MPTGRDIENNRIYVWPSFAETMPAPLTPAQDVEMDALYAPADAKTMRAANRFTGWRLAIGADGVWHTFRKVE